METTKHRWMIRLAACVLMALGAVWAPWPQAAAQQSASSSSGRIRINPLIDALEHGKIAEDGAGFRNPGGVWTFIDMEHGGYPTLEQIQVKLAAMADIRKPNGQLASCPLVRVPMYGEESPRWIVKQILDSGGMGIIFPQVDTKEQALRAIRSMRYPPQRDTKYPNPPGNRGFGSSGNYPLWFVDGKAIGVTEYLKRADLWPLNPEGEMFAVIMIESPLGVQNINEILDVPGIGAIFIGPSDMGMSLGVGAAVANAFAGRKDLPDEELGLIDTVGKACQAKKVICGIAAVGWASKERKQKLIDQGFRFFQ